MNEHSDLASHRMIIDICLRRGTPFFWHSPGTLLISPDGIVDVLRDVSDVCEVIGAEGFELEGATIHPRLDLIFDSDRTPDRRPVDIVRTWGPDVWVDLTIRLPPPM